MANQNVSGTTGSIGNIAELASQGTVGFHAPLMFSNLYGHVVEGLIARNQYSPEQIRDNVRSYITVLWPDLIANFGLDMTGTFGAQTAERGAA